MEATHKQN